MRIIPTTTSKSLHAFALSLCALVLLLVLASCGTQTTNTPTTTGQTNAGTTPTGQTPNIDVCSLVTAAEMSQILGSAVQSKPQTIAGGYPGCHYTPTTGGISPDVLVTVFTENSQVTYDGAQISYKSQPGYQELSGLGDKAIMTAGGLFFMKGSICVNILLVSTEINTIPQKAQQIAQIAVKRVP